MRIRSAEQDDATDWHRLRCQLWPGRDAEHEREIQHFLTEGLAGLDSVLLAESDSRIVGFAELSIRPYAEGCRSKRVGYLEGWYVSPEVRRTGVGKGLVLAAEDWARQNGCSEFASDTEPGNEDSRLAHLACEFEEVGLVRCFRKDLY